jgi:hypothetical protein
MHSAKWEKPNSKVYILCDLNSVEFLQMQNRGDKI